VIRVPAELTVSDAVTFIWVGKLGIPRFERASAFGWPVTTSVHGEHRRLPLLRTGGCHPGNG
jgi:hypothetical protein